MPIQCDQQYTYSDCCVWYLSYQMNHLNMFHESGSTCNKIYSRLTNIYALTQLIILKFFNVEKIYDNTNGYVTKLQ